MVMKSPSGHYYHVVCFRCSVCNCLLSAGDLYSIDPNTGWLYCQNHTSTPAKPDTRFYPNSSAVHAPSLHLPLHSGSNPLITNSNSGELSGFIMFLLNTLCLCIVIMFRYLYDMFMLMVYMFMSMYMCVYVQIFMYMYNYLPVLFLAGYIVQYVLGLITNSYLGESVFVSVIISFYVFIRIVRCNFSLHLLLWEKNSLLYSLCCCTDFLPYMSEPMSYWSDDASEDIISVSNCVKGDKRPRTVLSASQRRVLKRAFDLDPKPSKKVIKKCTYSLQLREDR